MARYNSVNSTNSVGAGSTISSPFSGLLTTIPSAGTVTIPNPVLYTGTTQTFYNAAPSGNVTLTTPSGIFNGPGAGGTSSFTLPFGSIVTLVSDGTNYITQDWLGGPISTTTLSASSTVTLSPANTTVTISPSGSGTVIINPATASSMDNVNVGATTQGTGKFSSLIATGTLSTTATTAATLGTTGTGALQVSGGASVVGILNVGGDSYHLGNVGIGTTPNKKLEVLSVGEIIRATSTTAANDQLISIKNNSGTADTSTNIFFADRYAASSYASSYIRGTSSGASALIFATGGTNFTNIYDAGAPTERMRINAAGAVGVGNAPFQYGASTSVGAELSIQSSNTTNAALTVQAGLSRYWIATPFGTNQLQIGGNGGGMPAAGVINITAGGLVGIGNTNPAVSLDLSTKTDAIAIPVGTTAQRPASPATGQHRYNSTTGFAEYYNGTGWAAYGNSSPSSVSYLIVAGGGGGGGYIGGGGGAGGLLYSLATAVIAGNPYSIVVGGGGAGGVSAGGGTQGNNSSFNSQIAIAGGAGGPGESGAYGTSSGGSGGGQGRTASGRGGTVGTGTSGQGNNGGSGVNADGTNNTSGGGGGGNTGVGGNGSGGTPGNGGSGGQYSIGGSAQFYAGGGGGGAYTGSNSSGGSGVGGNGSGGQGTGPSTPTPYTGSGGGAGGYSSSLNGTAGATGVVIIAYPTSFKLATATGTYTQSTANGNYIFTFTGNGTITF